jgi:hypothetical protein
MSYGIVEISTGGKAFGGINMRIAVQNVLDSKGKIIPEILGQARDEKIPLPIEECSSDFSFADPEDIIIEAHKRMINNAIGKITELTRSGISHIHVNVKDGIPIVSGTFKCTSNDDIQIVNPKDRIPLNLFVPRSAAGKEKLARFRAAGAPPFMMGGVDLSER